MSKVDIANEFSDMIITVGDEMLETLINMKR